MHAVFSVSVMLRHGGLQEQQKNTSIRS